MAEQAFLVWVESAGWLGIISVKRAWIQLVVQGLRDLRPQGLKLGSSAGCASLFASIYSQPSFLSEGCPFRLRLGGWRPLSKDWEEALRAAFFQCCGEWEWGPRPTSSVCLSDPQWDCEGGCDKGCLSSSLTRREFISETGAGEVMLGAVEVGSWVMERCLLVWFLWNV